MDASHSRRTAATGSVLNRLGTALCAAAVLFAGTVVNADAQTVPAAPAAAVPATASNATPADQTTPATTADAPKTVGQAAPPPRTPPPPPPLGHWPIIDFVVTFTQPAYYGNRNAVPITGLSPVNKYDPLDVGGTVRIPVTRKLNLLFDRITEGTINQPLECVLQSTRPTNVATATARICPSDSRDIILQYHGTYAFDRYVTLDVGDSFRHRIWTNGGNGVSTVPYLCNNNGRSTGPNCTVSSTEHHYGYLGLTYTTKPWKDLWNSAFALNLTGQRQNVDHHVGMVCSAALLALLGPGTAARQLKCPNGNGNVGYYDENPAQSTYYTTTQGVTWILPVDIRHGTTFTLNERWGTLNWYENPTLNPGWGTTIGQPYRWSSALTYQLNKRFNAGFTLALRHSDYHSSAVQGTPFVQPNAIHVGSWDVLGTFHLDTNTFFH